MKYQGIIIWLLGTIGAQFACKTTNPRNQLASNDESVKTNTGRVPELDFSDPQKVWRSLPDRRPRVFTEVSRFHPSKLEINPATVREGNTSNEIIKLCDLTEDTIDLSLFRAYAKFQTGLSSEFRLLRKDGRLDIDDGFICYSKREKILERLEELAFSFETYHVSYVEFARRINDEIDTAEEINNFSTKIEDKSTLYILKQDFIWGALVMPSGTSIAFSHCFTDFCRDAISEVANLIHAEIKLTSDDTYASVIKQTLPKAGERIICMEWAAKEFNREKMCEATKEIKTSAREMCQSYANSRVKESPFVVEDDCNTACANKISDLCYRNF